MQAQLGFPPCRLSIKGNPPLTLHKPTSRGLHCALSIRTLYHTSLGIRTTLYHPPAITAITDVIRAVLDTQGGVSGLVPLILMFWRAAHHILLECYF